MAAAKVNDTFDVHPFNSITTKDIDYYIAQQRADKTSALYAFENYDMRWTHKMFGVDSKNPQVKMYTELVDTKTGELVRDLDPTWGGPGLVSFWMPPVQTSFAAIHPCHMVKYGAEESLSVMDKTYIKDGEEHVNHAYREDINEMWIKIREWLDHHMQHGRARYIADNQEIRDDLYGSKSKLTNDELYEMMMNAYEDEDIKSAYKKSCSRMVHSMVTRNHEAQNNKLLDTKPSAFELREMAERVKFYEDFPEVHKAAESIDALTKIQLELDTGRITQGKQVTLDPLKHFNLDKQPIRAREMLEHCQTEAAVVMMKIDIGAVRGNFPKDSKKKTGAKSVTVGFNLAAVLWLYNGKKFISADAAAPPAFSARRVATPEPTEGPSLGTRPPAYEETPKHTGDELVAKEPKRARKGRASAE
jgi:hypothetical protein